MWFSNKEGLINVTATNESSIITFTNPSPFFINNTDLDTSIVRDADPLRNFNALSLINEITVTSGLENVPYSYVITLNDEEIYRQDNLKGSDTYSFVYPASLGTGIVKFFIISNNTFSYVSELTQSARYLGFSVSNPTNTINYNSNSNLISIVGLVDLQAQAPDIKQIDLITGVIKMFNIALTANQNGDIVWQTLPDWYSEGKEFKDFEKYIDNTKTTISRGKLNNEFDFKYEDPSTILAIQFEKNEIDAYGDINQRLTDEQDPVTGEEIGELLDGSKLEINLPFENMVNERLRDLADNTNISFQYGYSVDESLNPTVPKPVLFYNLKNQSPIIGFKEDDGTVTALLNQLNTPNNTNSLEDNTKQSINFSAELSTYNFGAMPNTLYNSFYSDYITDMFSNQRRVYVFDAIIPNFILANIKLNDRLIIANKRYIINSINSNLTTGKTKLELLNDIYDAGDLIGTQFYADPNFFTVSSLGEQIQSTIYNNGQTTLSLVDEGDGIFTSIVGATTFSGVTTKNFNVQSNNTGLPRVMSILCDNGIETFKITILQNASRTIGITFDNTQVSFDNTNLTFDNE